MSAPSPDLVDRRRDTVWWYAVVDSSAAADALARLGDPTLRSVTVGPLGLIVSDHDVGIAPASAFSAPPDAGVDLDLARAAVHHDEVVSGLAALVPALVPIRFGTLADDQELSSLGQVTVQRCADLLERVRGCQEWGLRLMTAGQGAVPEDGDAGSGADYLAAVRDRHRARREASAARDDLIGSLRKGLHALSTQAVELSTRRPGQLASLAYLVRRDRAARFHDTVRAAEDDLRGCGVAAVVTGPWAPYSFTDIGGAA